MTVKLSTNYFSINLGNTNLSIARSDEQTITNSVDNYPNLLIQLNKWINLPAPFYLLMCSVVSMEDFKARYPEVFQLVENFKNLKSKYYLDFHHLRLESSFMKMKTSYAINLGQDRLIQSYNLWKMLLKEKQEAGLLIDAGTMTTIDIVSATQGHLGGYIIPGLTSYVQIFNLSKKLPSQLDQIDSLKTSVFENLPITTIDAISFGYWHSHINLVQTLIKQHSLKKILISGGDGEFWMKNLDQTKICTLNTLFPHESLWQIGEDVLK